MENVKAEVGMILLSSWGYEQTNIEFFKVVKVSGKSVWIQAVKSQIVRQTGYLSEEVVPSDELVKGGWVKSEDGLGMVYDPEFTEAPQRKLWKGDSVKLADYKWAWLWDGKPRVASHYA
jgi:hypothetical protein